MSWQKCPVCHGTGKDAEEIATFGLNSGVPLKRCDVCDGKKIIHTGTGKPPKDDEDGEEMKILREENDRLRRLAKAANDEAFRDEPDWKHMAHITKEMLDEAVHL